MKKENLWKRIQIILQVAFKYASQHAQSLNAIKGTYHKQYPKQDPDFRYTEVLTIVPFGSLFKVIHSSYMDQELLGEKTCLATYGWHSNGHLIEIGGCRYWIFDPLQKTIYLEDYSDPDVKTVEVFVKI
ncbi:MAG: hypothetical protein P0Y49_09415 [Candidatus Pedobacter colombiensis]|uniref:Uncharacterized protein n=1 Tax=Candidatus Pedobacter colombiensis TaxID=3121371 RepID=A0AAJ5WC76_9SPHI|nr:hypothetical protein [Pedobacter sp.]WEK21358.1 MAG: hypothetical protein P0Y49_09415 [Pedobacter sp.]